MLEKELAESVLKCIFYLAKYDSLFICKFFLLRVPRYSKKWFQKQNHWKHLHK